MIPNINKPLNFISTDYRSSAVFIMRQYERPSMGNEIIGHRNVYNMIVVRLILNSPP